MISDTTALVVRVELHPRSGGWLVRLPGEPVIDCPTRMEAEQIARQHAQRDQRTCELVVLDAYARVIAHRPLTPPAAASTVAARRPPCARPRAPSDAAARTPPARGASRREDTENPCR